MIHPKLDLQTITTQLKSLGFTAITKLLFRRDFVDVRIENGIIPDSYPPDLDLPPLFFRVKVYGPGNEQYAQFDCDFGRMEVFDNWGE